MAEREGPPITPEFQPRPIRLQNFSDLSHETLGGRRPGTPPQQALI